MHQFQQQLQKYQRLWILLHVFVAGFVTYLFISSPAILAPWLFILAAITVGFIHLTESQIYLVVAGISIGYLLLGGLLHVDNVHVIAGIGLTTSGILFLLFLAHRTNAAQELIREQYDSLLRITLENPAPVFRVDKEGIVLYTNPSGTSHLQSLGTNILGKIPLAWHTFYQTVCDSGKPASFEYQTPNGTSWYSAHFVPVDGHDYVNIYVSDVTNLRETQHHLEDQTLFLQNILDTISTHIFLRNPNGKITLANQAFADFCGTTPEDLIGKTNSDLVPDPVVAAQIDLEDRTVFETGQDIYIAADLVVHESGEISWLHKIKRPFFSQGGKQTHVMVVATDITESVLAEQALEAERNLLRILMDNLPDFVFIKDLEGRYITVNESLRQRINADSVNEIIGKTDFDFFPTESLTMDIFKIEQKIMQSGTPSLNQLERLGERDTLILALASKIPLYDKNGETVGLIGITRDVTSLIDAENELRTAKEQVEEKHQLLDTLITSIPDSILVKDREGRFIVTNKAYMATYAPEHESVIGKTDFDIHPAMATEYVAEDQRLMESGETLVEQINLDVPTDEGTESRWLMRTKFPFRDHHGEITGIVGINRDITAIKQAEIDMRIAKETAEAADRAKSEFLANMSHEIRTPMNAVIGMSSLLLDTQLNSEQSDYVQTIRTSGEMLLGIINDILDFSKIESDKLEIERQPFSLIDCLEETLALFFATTSSKGIELVADIAENIPPTILGDVTRVRQVLANLLSNAVKFTEQGEIILSVSCKPVKENVVHLSIAVRDTGIGINSEKLETLFESFAQADASTTRRYGGTGLGLSISRKLAGLMGGELWAESEEGTGSVFHFELKAEVVPTESDLETSHRRSVLVGKQVLIVDDNEVNRRLLAEQLSRWSVQPVIAASGDEALALANECSNLDAAILDIQMPDMDGFQLATKLQDSKGLEDLPMLFASSMPTENLRTQYPRFNETPILMKPVRRSQLFMLLSTMVDEDKSLPDRMPVQGSTQEPQTTDISSGTHRRGAATPYIEPLLDLSSVTPSLPQDSHTHAVVDAQPISPTDELSTRQLDSGNTAQSSDVREILLVEDNLVNQKVALKMLERLGYEVSLAINGLEAIEAIEQKQYDIILMDLQMPEMGGIEATMKIRQQKIWAHEPYIIAMTADAMDGAREKCLAAGMDNYITKPVRLEKLSEVLETAIGNIVTL